MRRFPARRWVLLAALVTALALIACLILWNAPGGEWVAVERDGVELFRFRPADMEGVQTFDVPCDGRLQHHYRGKWRSVRLGSGLP